MTTTTHQSHIANGVINSNKRDYDKRTAPAYRITVDPDQSWGYHTAMSYTSIVELVQQHHLADGTQFDNGQFTVWIVEGKIVKIKKPKVVDVMGMELDEWTEGSCIAHFGYGDTWATLYDIRSEEEGKGHATALLTRAKTYYELLGKTVGGSVALNSRMKRLYEKVGYKEY